MPSLNLASVLIADDRTSVRYRLLLEADLGAGGGTSVTVHDISQSGVLFEADAQVENDAEIALDIPGVGPVVARTVWTNGSFYGAHFARPLASDRLKAALSQSRVVWPEFAPSPPIDIAEARARQNAIQPAPVVVDNAPAVAEPVQPIFAGTTAFAESLREDAKLPLPVRIRIIVGLTVVLWAGLLAPLWLAFVE